ncbi:MAG: tRNA (adenosine(37)-N6)-dimethylallyltransferase MiaA [Bacteroidales bacterium]|jgi:tRNA dimethylallyltransferase|nr:tRNA (adenosine(37)-N6)-dimethylallyltransferase MiaA [Bacteroidales bacterium]
MLQTESAFPPVPPELLKAKTPLLCVLAGPTAVGKTNVAIQWARTCKSCVISADSRQFYKEMTIGTAKPSLAEMSGIPHYFIGHLSISDYYSVSRFEHDVLQLLPSLFARAPVVFLAGGSGLYIDAVCKGMDCLPDPDPHIRAVVAKIHEEEGIESLRARLRVLDPRFYQQTDIANPKRLIRALEVCLQTGKPYSSQLTAPKIQRPFTVRKYCLTRSRPNLFDRINQRVEIMMQNGLLHEVKSLLPYRHYNALNTVGYKELFQYIDHEYTLEQAVENIKTHTRHYAKRQLSWIKRDGEYESIDM